MKIISGTFPPLLFFDSNSTSGQVLILPPYNLSLPIALSLFLSLDLSLVQRLPSTQMQEWVDERYIREELPRLVVGGHSNWEGELVPPLPHVGLFFPIFYEDKQT